MKKLFKEAHKMTREIKAEFNEVDYQAQFSICLSYLQNKEEEEMLKELQGTEKQVKYAKVIADGFMHLVKDLPKAIEKYSKDEKMASNYIDLYNNEVTELFQNYKNAGDFIGDWKEMLNTKTETGRVYILKDILKSKGIKITARIMNKMADEYFIED